MIFVNSAEIIAKWDKYLPKCHQHKQTDSRTEKKADSKMKINSQEPSKEQVCT